MQIFQRDFSLTWEQINELYNHVTDDSKSELTFEKFEDLVKCLWHNKLIKDTEKTPFFVSQTEMDFIQQNAAQFFEIQELGKFKKMVREKMGTAEFELSDETLAKVYSKMQNLRDCGQPSCDLFKTMLVKSQSRKSDFMQNDSGRERPRSVSGFDKCEDFDRLERRQVLSLKKLMHACTTAKQTENSDTISKLVFEVVTHGEESQRQWESLARILGVKNEYIEYLAIQHEQHRNEFTDLQKKVEELIEELSSEKSSNGFLRSSFK